MSFQLEGKIQQFTAIISSSGEFIQRRQNSNAQRRAIAQPACDGHIARKADLDSERLRWRGLEEQFRRLIEQLRQFALCSGWNIGAQPDARLIDDLHADTRVEIDRQPERIKTRAEI